MRAALVLVVVLVGCVDAEAPEPEAARPSASPREDGALVLEARGATLALLVDIPASAWSERPEPWRGLMDPGLALSYERGLVPARAMAGMSAFLVEGGRAERILFELFPGGTSGQGSLFLTPGGSARDVQLLLLFGADADEPVTLALHGAARFAHTLVEAPPPRFSSYQDGAPYRVEIDDRRQELAGPVQEGEWTLRPLAGAPGPGLLVVSLEATQDGKGSARVVSAVDGLETAREMDQAGVPLGPSTVAAYEGNVPYAREAGVRLEQRIDAATTGELRYGAQWWPLPLHDFRFDG